VLLAPGGKSCSRAGLRVQVTNGGSNLSYGLRSLYSKHFSRFDEWLTRPTPAVSSEKASTPVAAVKKPEPDDVEAKEAAAILESLMGTGAEQAAARQETKKRKASVEKTENGKVRRDSSVFVSYRPRPEPATPSP
jgi:hypothetical protein